MIKTYFFTYKNTRFSIRNMGWSEAFKFLMLLDDNGNILRGKIVTDKYYETTMNEWINKG